MRELGNNVFRQVSQADSGQSGRGLFAPHCICYRHRRRRSAHISHLDLILLEANRCQDNFEIFHNILILFLVLDRIQRWTRDHFPPLII